MTKQDHDFDEFFVDIGKTICYVSKDADIVYNIKEDTFGFICYSNYEYNIDYNEGNIEYYQYCTDCIALGDSLLDCINKTKGKCLNFRKQLLENPLCMKDNLERIKNRIQNGMLIEQNEYEKASKQHYNKIEKMNNEIKWANEMLDKCIIKKKKK